MISPMILIGIYPGMPMNLAQLYAPLLNETMQEFDINNTQRRSMWLAQILHESMGLRHTLELADGLAYEPPGRLATRLGNKKLGDGPRYKGRGLIQITGRRNYGLAGFALGLDLIANPELLEAPPLAARSAGWFWTTGAGLNLSGVALHHLDAGCDLNDVADRGGFTDFIAVTLAINGGMNGFDHRKALYDRAQAMLGA